MLRQDNMYGAATILFHALYVCFSDHHCLVWILSAIRDNFEFCKLVRAECVRTNIVSALADVVATKLGIIGANELRAHARCSYKVKHSGH